MLNWEGFVELLQEHNLYPGQQASNKHKSPFERLPIDCIKRIAQLLSPPDYYQLLRCCRTFHQVLGPPELNTSLLSAYKQWYHQLNRLGYQFQYHPLEAHQEISEEQRQAYRAQNCGQNSWPMAYYHNPDQLAVENKLPSAKESANELISAKQLIEIYPFRNITGSILDLPDPKRTLESLAHFAFAQKSPVIADFISRLLLAVLIGLHNDNRIEFQLDTILSQLNQNLFDQKIELELPENDRVQLYLFLFSSSHLLLNHIKLQGEVGDNKKITNLSLKNSQIQHAKFAYYHFANANLFKCQLQNSTISYCDFNDAKLRGCKFDNSHLSNVSFSQTDLAQASFNNCMISHSEHHPGFTGANLSNAEMSQATLYHCNFYKAIFRNATLHGTKFNRANLEGAIFDGADIRGANFTDANLEGCSFRDCLADERTLIDRRLLTFSGVHVKISNYIKELAHPIT